MAKSESKKHVCHVPEGWTVKVTTPGISDGMSETAVAKLARERTRFYADSPVIRQMPRTTIQAKRQK